MRPIILTHLNRWLKAGIISEETHKNIEAFEASQTSAKKTSLRWPAIISLVFGLHLFASGLLLFVAANWDRFSPGARFTQLLMMLALLHGLGIWCVDKNPKLSTALHGLGTIALGAAIYLTGQIFNLSEHWPTGVLLWAIGASLGHWLLRDWLQGALAAMLIPSWLASEWVEYARARTNGDQAVGVVMCAMLVFALAYLSARKNDSDPLLAKAMGWIGGISVIPLALANLVYNSHYRGISNSTCITMLIIASLIALLLVNVVRKERIVAIVNFVAMAWALPLCTVRFASWALYGWAVLGSVGFVIWGLFEERRERINIGIAGFAITVLSFYFSHLMDKLGRSLSMMGLGALFLIGGWQLERLRRNLNARTAGTGQ